MVRKLSYIIWAALDVSQVRRIEREGDGQVVPQASSALCSSFHTGWCVATHVDSDSERALAQSDAATVTSCSHSRKKATLHLRLLASTTARQASTSPKRLQLTEESKASLTKPSIGLTRPACRERSISSSTRAYVTALASCHDAHVCIDVRCHLAYANR